MNKLKTKETEHKWHWSSTEDSSTNAWFQYFLNGYQGNNGKTNSYWARAVRRVKVSR